MQSMLSGTAHVTVCVCGEYPGTTLAYAAALYLIPRVVDLRHITSLRPGPADMIGFTTRILISALSKSVADMCVCAV
jgi:hypothetical protein